MAITGFAFHEDMLKHDTGPYHPEQAARLEAIREAIVRAKLELAPISVVPADTEDILRVHAEEHVNAIRRTCATTNSYEYPDTPMVEASWDAAFLSVGATISACKAVLEGEVKNAFCAVRPPGHHAERDRAMGFCLFNNTAIAARWLQHHGHAERVAILDWDVHHGNGTQHAFYDDPSVYYVSLHQHPHYPGTGYPFERGAEDTNLNIQMPHGSGAKDWTDAISGKVLPELERFAPDFLLISAGFDTHRLDALGEQELETDTFADMTNQVKHLAGGRVVSALEGGYHLGALGECVVAHLRALMQD